MAIGDLIDPTPYFLGFGFGVGEGALAGAMGYGIATLGMQARLPPATIYALSAGAGLGVTVVGKKITTLEGLDKHKMTLAGLVAGSALGSAFAFQSVRI